MASRRELITLERKRAVALQRLYESKDYAAAGGKDVGLLESLIDFQRGDISALANSLLEFAAYAEKMQEACPAHAKESKAMKRRLTLIIDFLSDFPMIESPDELQRQLHHGMEEHHEHRQKTKAGIKKTKRGHAADKNSWHSLFDENEAAWLERLGDGWVCSSVQIQNAIESASRKGDFKGAVPSDSTIRRERKKRSERNTG